ALANIKVPTFLARDLPIRREQAALGVTIAAASLEQAQQETVYAVTRLYHTVLYARAQKTVTDGVVVHMSATRKTVDDLIKAGARDVTTSTRDKIDVYLGLAQNKQAEATQGVDRALAALREAIGLEPGCPVSIAEKDLPSPNLTIDQCEIVSLALA